VGEACADVAADGRAEDKAETDMFCDVAEPVVCKGAYGASRGHREKRRALGEMLGHADEDDKKGYHDAASPDTHHPREESRKCTGADEGRIVEEGTDVIGGLEDGALENEEKGHDDEEPSEGPLQSLLGKRMGVEGPKTGCGHGAGGEDERRLPIGEAVKGIRDRTDEAGKDNREKTRAMGLVLGESGEYDHERDHDDTASEPDEAPEGSAGQPDQETFSLTPVERFRRHAKPIYHGRTGLSINERPFQVPRKRQEPFPFAVFV